VAGTNITEVGLKAIVAFENENLQVVRVPTRIPKAALDKAKKLRPKVLFSY
jgi:hypothetical protein